MLLQKIKWSFFELASGSGVWEGSEGEVLEMGIILISRSQGIQAALSVQLTAAMPGTGRQGQKGLSKFI